jgi:hypothetical protein
MTPNPAAEQVAVITGGVATPRGFRAAGIGAVSKSARLCRTRRLA